MLARLQELRARRPVVLAVDAKHPARYAGAGATVLTPDFREAWSAVSPSASSGPQPSVDLARYYEFEHYRPLVQRGAVVVARSEDELAAAVRQALADPQIGAISRRNLLLDMFGHSLDGYSAVRVAEQLASVAVDGRHRRAGAGRRVSAEEHEVVR